MKAALAADKNHDTKSVDRERALPIHLICRICFPSLHSPARRRPLGRDAAKLRGSQRLIHAGRR